MRRRNNLGNVAQKKNGGWRIFLLRKIHAIAFVCSGQEVKILPSSRVKGKGKCVVLVVVVLCVVRKFWCSSTMLFAMKSYLCVWVQRSHFMTNINIGWHQHTPTAIGRSGREKCHLFAPRTNVVFAVFVYALIIIQSHNKTLELCMKCISRNLIWIGFHTVHECGLDWSVKINVHFLFLLFFLLFGWY